MFELVAKDLLQAFKDKRAILLSFFMPIILIALFALVYGGFINTPNDKPQNILFCDEDASTVSKELQTALENEKGLHIIPKTSNEARKLVLDGKYPSALVIYKGFSDSITKGGETPIEFLYDESREMEMGLTQKALLSTLMPFLGEAGSKGKVHQFIDKKYAEEMPEEMLAELHRDIEEQFISDSDNSSSQNSNIKSTALSVKAGIPWGLIQAFAGTSVMMLLFSIAGMGSNLIKERENGTLKRILYSPIQAWQIILGKLMSGFIFALLQMIVLVVFTWLAFGLDIFANFGGFVLLVVSTAFAASGFGILIAAISRSQKQVESLSLITILVMSALGGSMIPLFVFPEFLKSVAAFTINYWAISGFYDVLGRDVGLSSHLINTSVLLLFGAGSSLIAIFIFTKRLQRDF